MDTVETLVRQAQGGDEDAEAAFGDLIERFWDSSVRWAYFTLGDFDLAQDAAQEAFIAAYRHMGDLQEPRAFPSWLRRIVLSQAGRLLRRQQGTTALDDDALASPDDPARELDEALLTRNVREAVRDLPAHERSVTELFYLDGYSQQEIADTLELPLTTVKKRLQYARERLKTAQPLIEQVFMQLGAALDADQPEDTQTLEEMFGLAQPLGILRSYVR